MLLCLLQLLSRSTSMHSQHHRRYPLAVDNNRHGNVWVLIISCVGGFSFRLVPKFNNERV